MRCLLVVFSTTNCPFGANYKAKVVQNHLHFFGFLKNISKIEHATTCYFMKNSKVSKTFFEEIYSFNKLLDFWLTLALHLRGRFFCPSEGVLTYGAIELCFVKSIRVDNQRNHISRTYTERIEKRTIKRQAYHTFDLIFRSNVFFRQAPCQCGFWNSERLQACRTRST
jgi:hypothetical protein